MRKLNKHKGIMSFEDAFKHMGQKEGYGKLLTRYCPKCGNPLLVFQIVCLECGMVATFESKIARSMQLVDYLKVVEAGALAIAAGPPRERLLQRRTPPRHCLMCRRNRDNCQLKPNTRRRP